MTATSRHAAIRLIRHLLFVAGLLALGYATYVVIDAAAYERIERRRLEKAAPNAAAHVIVTCYPFSYVGPAPDRFIVRARQL